MTQSLNDSHIAESIEEIQKGEFYGPFDSAEELIESLHQNLDGRRTHKRSR
jgi:hypothetical protein